MKYAALYSAVFAALTFLTTSDAWAEDKLLIPKATVSLGSAFHISPEPQSLEFALDATLGFTASLDGTLSTRSPSVFVTAEAGYSYDAIGLHAVNAATGVGYGTPMVFFTYNPRFIIGDLNGSLALGMRNSITGHLMIDILSLELGHQFIDVNGTLRHDVRTMFGVNPGAVVWLVTTIANAFSKGSKRRPPVRASSPPTK